MNFAIIPQDLDEWEISVIDELIKYPSIESESLDLKSDINELENHISAMANSSGGFLVLGIKEIKSDNGKAILRYEKIGFDINTQEQTIHRIGNALYEIDPIPTTKIRYLQDDGKIFPVIKIENEITKKPFIIKNKGQFYVRIDSSTRPASRSTVLNLFGASLEQTKSIKTLQATLSITKDELEKTVEHLRGTGSSIHSKIPTVDLTFLRNAIISANWFLIENELLNNTRYENFIFVIHTIEWLNVKINTFNSSYNETEKGDILQQLSKHSSYTLSGDIDVTIKFLSDVLIIIEEYLKKTEITN